MAAAADTFWQFEASSRELPARRREAAIGRDALLAKPDDRLLRDAGLTREDLLGAEGYFWFEWSRLREPWTL